MRLEQLQYFQKIAELRSIRRAAEELYLTPQSLSKSVMQLEEELGVTLYSRTRTGICLTPEGRQAYQQICRILDQVEDLKQCFHRQDSENAAAPVTLFSSSALEMFAMGVINQHLSHYPNVPIQVGKMGSWQINEILMKEKDPANLPDLVLTHCVPKELEHLHSSTAANYICYMLYEDVLCLQVPIGDPLAKLDAIPSELLVDLPLLLYSPVPTEKTQSEMALAAMGYELRNVSRIANFETTSQVAFNLHKYCFVGFPSVEFRPMSGVTYIPLEANLTTKELLLAKRSRKNRAITDAFLHSVDEYYDMQLLW